MSKLIRNPAWGGKGKYALIRLDKLDLTDAQIANLTTAQLATILVTEKDAHKLIEFGRPGSRNEFFVLKLKDPHTAEALCGYHGDYTPDEAKADDSYLADLERLIKRADKAALKYKT